MKCYVVKDLLPNYIEGLTSEETNSEIIKHLEECKDCHAAYEKMTEVIPQEIQSEDKNIDFLKKLRAKILRKNVIIAFVTFLLIAVGMCVLYKYAFYYEIPVQFDEKRMSVEILKTAVIKAENDIGYRSWRVLGDSEPKENEVVGEELTLVSNTHIKYETFVFGRDINRNGESIKVMYYCYRQKPITSFLNNYVNFGNSSKYNFYSLGWQVGDVYKEGSNPKKIEIYYLQDFYKNFGDHEGLRDEDIDALREKAILVWEGTI